MSNPLRQVGVFVTESCNLACGYCFAANMENRFVDPAIAKAAIELLFHESVRGQEVGVAFWGGEPLLAFPLIVDLVRFGERRAAETGKVIRFALPTNATLLDERKIDFFQEHNVSLSLSLDGAPDSQALRPTRGGRSSFPQVRSAIDLLHRRYGARLPGVRMTVCPTTAPRLLENARFFFSEGFTHLFFAPVHQAPWSNAQLAAYEDNQRQLADHWLSRLSQGEAIVIANWDKLLARRELIRKGQLDPTLRQVECGAGSSMLSVDIHGDLYPCHRFVFYDKTQRAHGLGNVLGALPAPEALAPFTAESIDCGTMTPRCTACNDSARCAMVYCPAVSYALTGTLNGLDERQCQLGLIDQRIAEHLETQGASVPAFDRHLAAIAQRAHSTTGMSAELSTFFSFLDDDGQQKVAERAAEILERLAARRQGTDSADES